MLSLSDADNLEAKTSDSSKQEDILSLTDSDNLEAKTSNSNKQDAILSLTDADNFEADTSNSNGIETVNGVNGAVNGPSTEKPKSPNKKSNEEEKNGIANDTFEEIVSEEESKRCTLEELIETMLIRQYDSTSTDDFLINLKCKVLFEKDYIVEVVENTFTSHYPKDIIVPVGRVKRKVDKESEVDKENFKRLQDLPYTTYAGSNDLVEKDVVEQDIVEQDLMEFDKDMYSQLVKDSLIARLRSRFVAPVILFDNKFICRSGTLTVWTSALYEKLKPPKPILEIRSLEDLSKLKPPPMPSIKYLTDIVKSFISTVLDVVKSPTRIPDAVFELWGTAWEYAKLMTPYIDLKELYAKDVKVLEYLKIERIFDLMVEYNKHYRSALNVSTTEKVNELYKKFKVEEMPYPGCEFFELYSAYYYSAPGLYFNWKQSDVTRTLMLTENPPQLFPKLDIQNFKQWDIFQLTQNYLKIMISYLVTGTGGTVVHCISGWDRTPFFVSLIRLSLWADGLIHESLNAEEIAYLTVAYDWFLFGHNLPDRIKKNEEIMHFFFIVAPWMLSDKFSATRMFQELPTEKKRNRTFPEFVPERRKELFDKIRAIFLPCARRISVKDLPELEEKKQDFSRVCPKETKET